VHTIGIRELRRSLATAVRRAAAGEATVISAHGRPVCQLAPLDAAPHGLDQLVASGALVPPRRVDAWRPPAPVTVWSGARVDRALRESRG
jgi:antitoxin (DNA-binding transcriptional repressor) of toxin-antitoxin stability system